MDTGASGGQQRRQDRPLEDHRSRRHEHKPHRRHRLTPSEFRRCLSAISYWSVANHLYAAGQDDLAKRQAPPSRDELKLRFKPVGFAFELEGERAFMQDFAPSELTNELEIAALLIEAPGDQTLE
jgi:hypothetical protein